MKDPKTYLKFVKEHKGMRNNVGDIVAVHKSVAKSWLDSEYCEKSTKAEYEKFTGLKQKEVKERRKKEVEEITDDGPNKQLTREIDKEDLEADMTLINKGFEEGHLVIVDANNAIIQDKLEESKKLNSGNS